MDRETARTKQIKRGGKRAAQAKKKKPLSQAQHRAAVKAGRASGRRRKSQS